MTAVEVTLGVAMVAGAALAGGALLAAAFLLTVGTFTSLRSLVRHPLSTLPTEPIDMDAPPVRRPRHRRLVHAQTDLRAAVRAAARS